LEEEAIRRAIEESELVELDNWEGLGAQLAASVSSSSADASSSRVALPPPPPPAPKPQPWGYAVWESPPCTPPIQVNWGPWGYAGSTRGAVGALVVSLGPTAAHRPHRGR
jgi:hypothetical protein